MLDIRRTTICILFIADLAASVLPGMIAPARGEELLQAVQNLHGKYAADLRQLADWCEEKGLKEQAEQTLAALGRSDPTKFYVPKLLVDIGPAKLPQEASPEMIEWDSRLGRLRREYSAAIFDLARRAAQGKHAGLALELALEAVRANPDNETARRMLGYEKYQNQWHTLYEIKKLRTGMVWHDKFGWLPKGQMRRYEEGQRYFNGKWISAAEDARRRRDIESGWDIETEHYTVRTNHSLEAGAALAMKLEELYRLWQQIFIRYYTSEMEVIRLFDERDQNQRGPVARHQVIYFRDRQDYNQFLRASIPNIDVSIGIYLDSPRTAYFFAGKDSDERTIYHEATHQLFHESREVADEVGRRANFWIIEGIALYMESLGEEKGYYVLGGFDDERMIAARHRLLEDDFYVPLGELTGLGMEAFQKYPRLPTLYSQATGLTNFLVHYDHGRYRDTLVAYLTAVYAGQDDSLTLSQLAGENYSELDKQYRKYMEQKK